MSAQQQQVITVKEARKILGNDSRKLTDTQIEEIIHTLSHIARNYLKNNGSKNKVG